MVVLDLWIRRWKKEEEEILERDTQEFGCGVLKGEKQDEFKDKLVKESMWDLDKDNVKMWSEVASCIKRVAKKVIGESKGCTRPD